jgi:DNA end-binding protein Ku
VLVRAMDKLLVMNLLEYAAQVKPPAEFESEAPNKPTNKEELKLTKLLVEALQQPEPHLDQFHDEYYDKLQELIDAKLTGREVVTPPEAAPARAINFMDALKASMKEVKAPRRTAKASAAKRTSSSHLGALRAVRKSGGGKKRRKSG